MSVLASFSSSELELLASLPYKAGVFVSHADDEDGETDDEQERQALEACIKAIADLHEGQAFTAEVMRYTLAMKTEWLRWDALSFSAPDDCRAGVALLSGKVSEEQLKDYCGAIIEIGTTVAQAYGEFNAFDSEEKKSGFGDLIGRVIGGFSGLSQEDENHPMNVSASEDSAIEQLRVALKG